MASAAQNSGLKRMHRGLLLLALLLGTLVTGYAILELVAARNTRETERGERDVVAAIRSLGGEVSLLVSEELFPLGRFFPGQSAARYRYAIKLRNPLVTDDQLAGLDRLDPDRVEALDLLCPKLGDATLERAARFRNLTLLGLGQARMSQAEPWPTTPAGLFSEKGFASLDHLPNLDTVGLHGPDFTDAALAHLRGAENLRVLILYGTRVTGKGLRELGPKAGLTTLKLGGTKFGDADLVGLANYPNLEVLDLRDTPVTDTGLARLPALKNLKLIVLNGCHVSEEAVAALKNARPGLIVGHDAAASAAPANDDPQTNSPASDATNP